MRIRLLTVCVVALCCGCAITGRVSKLGTVREVPAEVSGACFDDANQVLQISYNAHLVKAGDKLGGRRVRRRLVVPYGDLHRIELCPIDDLTKPDFVYPADPQDRSWFEKAVQPADVFETEDIPPASYTGRYLKINDIGSIDFYGAGAEGGAKVAELLRNGEAVRDILDILIPHDGRVLRVRLPRRETTRTWAKIAKVPLYPLAIIADLVVFPYKWLSSIGE